MRIGVKMVVALVLVFTLGMASAFAVGAGIKSAEYNTNGVNYNGKALDLSKAQMVSVVKDGETYFSNYMPVRAVLEQMGFVVDWDDNTNTVIVKDKTYDITVDGMKLRDEVIAELPFNIESDEYKEFQAYADILAALLGNDNALLMILTYFDYMSHLDGDNSIYGEYLNW